MTKTLIAYFSHSGNTRTVAEIIQKITGADIFEIKTVRKYSDDYRTCVDEAAAEKKSDARPELSTHVGNINDYDTIILGYPNWWGTMPKGVFTFLEEYNLAGKKIAPFCTHGGSRLGSSVSDIKSLCKDSIILEGLAVSDSGISSAEKNISAWIKKIGL